MHSERRPDDCALVVAFGDPERRARVRSRILASAKHNHRLMVSARWPMAAIRSIRHCDAIANPIMLCASIFRLVSWIISIIHERPPFSSDESTVPGPASSRRNGKTGSARSKACKLSLAGARTARLTPSPRKPTAPAPTPACPCQPSSRSGRRTPARWAVRPRASRTRRGSRGHGPGRGRSATDRA